MTLSEYATVIGVPIRITGHADNGLLTPASIRWTVSLGGVEVIEGGLATSHYGSGSTPRKAAADYVQQIAGKSIRDRYPDDRPDLRAAVFASLKPY